MFHVNRSTVAQPRAEGRSRTTAGSRCTPQSFLGRNTGPEILDLDAGHGRGKVHSFDLDHIAIDSSIQPLHPNSRRTHTACGSAGWVSSRTQSIAGRVLPCNCPEHIVGPRSCPRIEPAEISTGTLSKIDNAASVASSSASRYGHFVSRWSSRRRYSNRPILSTSTTIDARLSKSRLVVGRIVHEHGPAVVYLRILATPIFADIESDSDGRMSCPTYLPSAGSSAHTLRDRCPSLLLRCVSRTQFHCCADLDPDTQLASDCFT